MILTLLYGAIAIALAVIWCIVQARLVLRAQSGRVLRSFLCTAAVLLLIATLFAKTTFENQLMSYSSILILCLLAFWPKGLTQKSVIASLNVTRSFVALSKIEVDYDEQQAVTLVKCYGGQVLIAKLKFKVAQPKVIQFLKQHFPKKRLVILKEMK